MDRPQAEQLIDWMNPEQKPDQVMKIVKRAAFLFSDYHGDYTRVGGSEVEWRLGNTKFFPKFPIDKFLHLSFVWSLCTLLTVSLRVYAPMPVVTFFFFSFLPKVRVGCRWNHQFRGRLVALVPIPSNSMDLISPVKFGFLTPH